MPTDVRARLGRGARSGQMSITPTDPVDAGATRSMPTRKSRRWSRKWRLGPGEDSLVRSFPVALYRANPDGRFSGPRHVNPALAGILGYDAAAFVENGALWASRIHEEDLPRVLSSLADSVQAGRFSSEYRWLCADGSERIFQDRGLVVRTDRNDDPPQIHGTCCDITDRRRLDRQLLWAHRLESLELFTQDFVHDLKNRLVVVLWNLDGMKRAVETGVSDGRERDRVTVALAGAEACSALIEQFHMMAQPSVHRVQALDLPALLQRMQRLLATVLGDDITLEIVTASSLPAVYSDQVQLESILIALATRSRNAMADGGGTVRIEAVHAAPWNGAAPSTPTSDFVEVIVKDTGPPDDPSLDAAHQWQHQLISGLLVQDGGEIVIGNEADGPRTVRLRLPCR